jgi:GAF domain-containing protein
MTPPPPTPPTEIDPHAPRRVDLAEAERIARLDAAEDARLTDDGGLVDKTAVALSVFNKLQASDGIRPALYSLLRLTNYRYLSIFRFKDGKATSAVHVDRENLALLQADEVPDTATYCCYVRDSHQTFVTADALTDARTRQHVAREVVRSYCGVPILTPEGELLGTLCHYDLVPRDPEQLDLDLLVRAASVLARSGRVPPYPVMAR